jgi:predicted RecB family nuclease
MTSRSLPSAILRSPSLGGSDIGRCLTRIHHDRFTPAVPIVDEVRERALSRGMDYEARIVAGLVASRNDVVQIEERAEPGRLATLVALERGDPIILGARLESDDRSLVGLPDILVRLDDGYAAVDVKNHKVIGENGPEGTATPLALLGALDGDPVRFRSFRRRDLLQVAHYWHLLEAAGHSTAVPIGGVIGADQPTACVWVDLAQGDPPIAEECRTYRTDALAAIDHGRTHPDAPLASPWLRGECRSCDWYPTCMAELVAADDPTLLRDIDAYVRASLRTEGISTIAGIADLDPGDERVPGDGTVFQARARTAGRLLRSDRAGGAIDLPNPRIEVDFDIETFGGRTYLAGLLVTELGETTYEPICDWGATEPGERSLLEALFARFAAWAHDDVVVFHWTDYEQRILAAAATTHGLTVPGYGTVDEWFDDMAVDLCAWSRHHLVSPDGFSLKTIAPLCGFSWRDRDPGGLQSEIWFERLVAGESDMRDRLLAYNEDDVLAQLAVRRWIRRHDGGTGPGSGLPSVHDWPLAHEAGIP